MVMKYIPSPFILRWAVAKKAIWKRTSNIFGGRFTKITFSHPSMLPLPSMPLPAATAAEVSCGGRSTERFTYTAPEKSNSDATDPEKLPKASLSPPVLLRTCPASWLGQQLQPAPVLAHKLENSAQNRSGEHLPHLVATHSKLVQSAFPARGGFEQN